MNRDRHARIIELIETQDIETQEELANALRRDGFDVTQTTVSRDIRKLKLMKVPKKGGGQKYSLIRPDDVHSEKYVRILKDAMESMDSAQNIIVLKTVGGMASPAAAAIDGMHIGEVVGSIAGENTVLIVVRTNEDAPRIMQMIRAMVEEC